jgi:hypothetical protein
MQDWAAFCRSVVQGMSQEPRSEISMLPAEVLALITSLANASSGAIVEVGAYVGGATVEIAGAMGASAKAD